MADQKISQLTGGGAAQATDEYVVARAGGNNKITGANVAAAATSLGTIGTGVWQGTAIANAYIATGLDIGKCTVGTTLPSNVLASSLTSVGTLSSLTVSGNIAASGGAVLKGITNGTAGLGLEIGTSANGIIRAFNRTSLAYEALAIDGLTLALQGATAGATTVGGSMTVSGDLTVDTNTLKVDSANNRVGIGTASPTDALNVGAFSGNNVVTIGAGTTGVSSVYFGDGTGADRYRGYIDYLHTSDRFEFGTSAATKLTIDASGNLGLGVTPSAWGSSEAMQFAAGYSYGRRGMGVNAYFDGSAYKYIATGAASLYQPGGGTHTWYTAPSGTAGNAITFTQAMTLDASGNLLVNKTTASYSSANRGLIELNGTDAAWLVLQRNATAGTSGIVRQASTGMEILNRENTPLILSTNDTERARITSGGKFLIASASDAFSGNLLVVQATSANDTASIYNSATSGDNVLIGFYTDGGSGRGSITYNRTGGLVAYNTTSDYRAKDILGPVENAGATIDALQVYMGQMHGATVARPMLIAHEAQAVTPYAVTGEKDAVREESYEVTPAEKDEDGNVIAEAVMGVREVPVYQQMDHSSYVPLLIAEIQSLRARVAALEA